MQGSILILKEIVRWAMTFPLNVNLFSANSKFLVSRLSYSHAWKVRGFEQTTKVLPLIPLNSISEIETGKCHV
jgi:hypothetical protein